ncbi:MAG: hypothetical protein LUI14_08165 [Lachnospiraceae bacterium]|nr:hypothetical protein [Lachnospiraceae bacterium]
MGFKCAIQLTGLVRGESNGKHRSNGKAILGEMGKERISSSVTLDRSRSSLNTYEGESDSGFAVWDDMERRANECRLEVQGKDKSGNPVIRHRRLPHNTVIGCAVIINPPYEVCTDWTREQYDKFYQDSWEILCEFQPDIFRDENIRFSAIHRDEGLETVPPQIPDEHLHRALDCISPDGRYCGNLIDSKFYTDFNKVYPARMRERGWDMDDLDVTDWERYKTDDEYKAERKAKAKNSGKSVNAHAFGKAAKAMEEANAAMVENHKTERRLMATQKQQEQVARDQKEKGEYLDKTSRQIDRAFRKSFSSLLGTGQMIYGDYDGVADILVNAAKLYKVNTEAEAQEKADKTVEEKETVMKRKMNRSLREERVEIEQQYRQDEAELELYFLTRQAALEQASLEEQLELEADLKKKQDELDTDISEVKRQKAKVMQEDPSRQEWMQKIHYKDGSTAEDRYQAHLAKQREARADSERHFAEIAEKYNSMRNSTDKEYTAD